MNKQIIRYGVISCNDFTSPTGPKGQVFGALDDASGGAFIDGGIEYIMLAGGTNNGVSQPISVYNDAWLSTDGGKAFQWHSEAPWAPANAIPYCQTNVGFETPRVIYVGFKTNEITFDNKAYYFDRTGWHLISDNVQGLENVGYFCELHFDEEQKMFYMLPGLDGDGRIRKSTDGANWEYHAMMPAPYVEKSGQMAFTVFKGIWYLAGGHEDIGYFYKSYDRGTTWILIRTDPEMFGYLWPELCACADFMMYKKGGRTNGSAIGYKDTYYLTDTDTDEFIHFVGVEPPGSHAGTLFPTAKNDGVYNAFSNMHAEFGKARDIVKYPD